MAGVLVGDLAAQEQLDSLSYAMGDYFIRMYLDGNDKETQQVMGDREEYIRGFSDGLNVYRQETTAASSYFNGQQMGLFFLMSINFEPYEDKEKPHLDYLIEGLRKVADNTYLRTPVTVSSLDNDRMIVTNGLSEKDAIITEGAFYLIDSK